MLTREPLPLPLSLPLLLPPPLPGSCWVLLSLAPRGTWEDLDTEARSEGCHSHTP